MSKLNEMYENYMHGARTPHSMGAGVQGAMLNSPLASGSRRMIFQSTAPMQKSNYQTLFSSFLDLLATMLNRSTNTRMNQLLNQVGYIHYIYIYIYIL